MRWFFAFWCCAIVAMGQENVSTSEIDSAPASSTPAVTGTADIHLVLDLSDGSRVIGIPSIERLEANTDYAQIYIPLRMLQQIEFSGTSPIAQATLTNHDSLRVRLAASEIDLKTIFGSVRIPIAEVRNIGTSGGTPGINMPKGLILYYSFDTDQGQNVVDDSGNGISGTVNGATYTAQGKKAGAMSFNGKMQAVIIPNNPSLQIQDFTISAWIKRDSTSLVSITGNGYCILFGYGRGGYGFGLDPGGSLMLGKVWGPVVTGPVVAADQQFHHVAVTKHGTTVVFYLDGVAHPAPSFDLSFVFNTNLGVGGLPDSLEDSFLGVIDEVGLFNRALSDTEVIGLYNAQK